LQLNAFSNFGRFDSGPIYAILRDWMRIRLHHQPLRLGTNLVSTKLSPCNEELLLWRKTIDVGGTRFALERLLVREVRNLGPS